MTAKKLTKAQIKRWSDYNPPKGWTKDSVKTKATFSVMELKSDDMKLSIWLNHTIDEFYGIWGNMSYKVGDTWYTTERIGVESSFYYANDKSLGELIDEQTWIANRRRERNSTLVELPGTRMCVTPERLESIKSKLRLGEQVSLMPSGFGTGYVLTTGPTKRYRGYERWRRAPSTLNDLLKVDPPIYIHTFDAD